MKKNVILLFPVLVAILILPVLAACQQPSVPPPSISTQGNARVYTNFKYGFSFTICDNKEFEVVQNYGGTLVALRGPLLADLKTQISIYMIAKEVPKNTKLEDFLAADRKESEKTLSNFALLSEGTTTIGNIQARRTSFTYTATLSEQDYTFKNTLVVFMKDNVIYAMKYETPDESYDEFVDCFNVLISTFKFL